METRTSLNEVRALPIVSQSERFQLRNHLGSAISPTECREQAWHHKGIKKNLCPLLRKHLQRNVFNIPRGS